MFANFAGLYRHADLVALLFAMLILLSLIARAPIAETAYGVGLNTASACTAQTACPHLTGA